MALTGNALRPLPGPWTGFQSFVAGWLTAELAPQLLVLTAADVAAHLVRHGARRPADRVALAAAGLSVAGLVALIRAGDHARDEVETALREGLGADYAEHLGHPPTEPGLAAMGRQLANPLWMWDQQVVRTRDLGYADGGRRGRLDVYHAADRSGSRPVLLQIHGGGWMVGHKRQQGIPLMLNMVHEGWVSVAANYPLSPRATWPAHVIALKRALAWIRANIADYGGDPEFVAVTGGSAGGHLAALLALTPNVPEWQPGFEDADTSVQACAPHYGPYDLAAESGTADAIRLRDLFFAPLVLRKSFARNEEQFVAASPLARVNAAAPPFFVVHGSNDSLIPVTEARAFVRRLREVSTQPVAYAELSGAQHAFDIFPSIRSAHVVRGVARFLDWTYQSSRPAHSRQTRL